MSKFTWQRHEALSQIEALSLVHVKPVSKNNNNNKQTKLKGGIWPQRVFGSVFARW